MTNDLEAKAKSMNVHVTFAKSSTGDEPYRATYAREGISDVVHHSAGDFPEFIQNVKWMLWNDFSWDIGLCNTFAITPTTSYEFNGFDNPSEKRLLESTVQGVQDLKRNGRLRYV